VHRLALQSFGFRRIDRIGTVTVWRQTLAIQLVTRFPLYESRAVER
jgi:hypothetical protein